MVDVVKGHTDVSLLAIAYTWHGFLASVQADDVANGCNDVVNRQNRFGQSLVDTQFAVDLVTAHLGQIVALGVEVEVAQKGFSSVNGCWFRWTQFLVDVQERFFTGADCVLGQSVFNGVELTKLFKDL